MQGTKGGFRHTARTEVLLDDSFCDGRCGQVEPLPQLLLQKAEQAGKEIVGFNVVLTIYVRENSREARPLEDIEASDSYPSSRRLLSIPLPDIEF